MSREGRTVCKCDKLSMEILERYETTAQAGAASGEDPRAISLTARRRHVSRLAYVWRYLDDYDPNESFEGKANRPVVVRDSVTGAVAAYPTIKDASKALGVSLSWMYQCRKHGLQVKDRFVFTYAR